MTMFAAFFVIFVADCVPSPRELAQQIYLESKKFGKGYNLRYHSHNRPTHHI
jgi:hypothetical protein